MLGTYPVTELYSQLLSISQILLLEMWKLLDCKAPTSTAGQLWLNGSLSLNLSLSLKANSTLSVQGSWLVFLDR